MNNSSVCPLCQIPFSKEITNCVDGLTYLKCGSCEIEALALDANQDRKKWFLHQQEQYFGELDDSNSPILLETEAQENAKRLAIVKNFLKAGSKICEVGPGSGRYAAALKLSDFEIVVVEQARISTSLAAMLSGIELHNIDFQMFAEKKSNFDAVCSFHVVEHIPNFLEHLKKANAIVKQGGYLFLATPSADAIQHKLPFRLSPHYDAAHFYVFSELALRKALEASGWELIEIRTNEYLVYWARIATKLFRKIFQKSETQTAGAYIQNAGLFSLCIYKFFSVFLSPLLKLQSSFHLGNELFVVAKKRQ